MSKIVIRLMVVLISALSVPAALAQTDVEISAVREGMDFLKYKKFLVQPLDISDTRLIPPPWAEGEAGKPRAWDISKKNAQFLQDRYQTAMQTQLEELGGYTLTEQPEDDALAVEIEIISLTPWAEPDGKAITKGSGEMTFRAEIRDSMTREILVVFEGDTPVGEDYQEHTEFSVQQNVGALFESWGELLRTKLGEAKKAQENP